MGSGVECVFPQIAAVSLAAVMKILAFSRQVKHLVAIYFFLLKTKF
jgi:hypothetical protein